MNLGVKAIVFVTKRNHLLTNVPFYLQIHWRKNFECYDRYKQFISKTLQWNLKGNLINHPTRKQTKPPFLKMPHQPFKVWWKEHRAWNHINLEPCPYHLWGVEQGTLSVWVQCLSTEGANWNLSLGVLQRLEVRVTTTAAADVDRTLTVCPARRWSAAAHFLLTTLWGHHRA